MKKLLIVIFVILMAVGLYADSIDTRSRYRNQGTPVFRIQVPRLAVASASTASTTSSRLNLNGRIKQISVRVNDVSTATVTAQVQLIDSSDLLLVYFDVSGIAAGTTLFNSATATTLSPSSTTALPMNILMAGSFTVVITPSGPPGSSTLAVDVDIFGD